MGYLDPVGHVFLLLSSMSETADDNDVLGWELDQLKKLKRLAEEYGWDEEDPKYKARLKQVQALGKQRALDALGKGGGKEPKGPKTTYVWESCMEFKAKDWTEAKYKLVKLGPLWGVGAGSPQRAVHVRRPRRAALQVQGQG